MTEPSAEARPRGGVLAGLQRMFERRLDRDGDVPALEPRTLDAAPAADAGDLGRRERRLRLPQEILDRSLGGKVLEGWLQNRHQVLVPLTLRLGRLDPDDILRVIRFTAVAVLNATDAGPASRRFAERWLTEIGASAEMLAPFREALDQPPALIVTLAALRERDLGPYAYAAAVAAVDARAPAARLFAAYIAARLNLPADAVRSIDRRARR